MLMSELWSMRHAATLFPQLVIVLKSSTEAACVNKCFLWNHMWNFKSVDSHHRSKKTTPYVLHSFTATYITNSQGISWKAAQHTLGKHTWLSSVCIVTQLGGSTRYNGEKVNIVITFFHPILALSAVPNTFCVYVRQYAFSWVGGSSLCLMVELDELTPKSKNMSLLKYLVCSRTTKLFMYITNTKYPSKSRKIGTASTPHILEHFLPIFWSWVWFGAFICN